MFYIGEVVHLPNFQPDIMVCESDLISHLLFCGMSGISGVCMGLEQRYICMTVL